MRGTHPAVAPDQQWASAHRLGGRLRDRRLRDRDNQRLLNEIGWHHDRGKVLRFLVEAGVPPTNKTAQSGLCGGRWSRARFASVVRTFGKRDPERLLDGLVSAMTTGAVPA